MDAKITKKRLAEMLSYDWLKIIAVAIAACIVWVCAFTFTGTGISNTQEFTVFNHKSNALLSDAFYSLLTNSTKDGTFSYEVLETQPVDLANKGDQANTFYESYLGAGVGDLIFVAYSEEEGAESQILLDSYFYHIQPADSFINEMKTYVAQYYENGNFANGVMDKAKVETDFRDFVKRTKDKRFKNEKQISAGLIAEYARIQLYADALVEFDGYLSKQYICYQAMTPTYAEDNTTKNFFLNLCPNFLTMGNLKKYLYQSVGENHLQTAQNMGVYFLSVPHTEPAYRFESLLFVNKLIRSSIVAQ